MEAANTVSAPLTRAEISRLKDQLGIQRLALQVHSASFPERIEAGGRGEDFGRGSPYSYGAERLYEWAAELGFDTIQLGPMGMTGRGNPSPYDATIFSRNPLDLPLARMVDAGRLSAATFESLSPRRPPYAGRRRSLFDDVRRAAVRAGRDHRRRDGRRSPAGGRVPRAARVVAGARCAVRDLGPDAWQRLVAALDADAPGPPGSAAVRPGAWPGERRRRAAGPTAARACRADQRLCARAVAPGRAALSAARAAGQAGPRALCRSAGRPVAAGCLAMAGSVFAGLPHGSAAEPDQS